MINRTKTIIQNEGAAIRPVLNARLNYRAAQIINADGPALSLLLTPSPFVFHIASSVLRKNIVMDIGSIMENL